MTTTTTTTAAKGKATTKAPKVPASLRNYTIDSAVTEYRQADTTEGAAILHRGKVITKALRAGLSVRDLVGALSDSYGVTVGKSTIANYGVAYQVLDAVGLSTVKSGGDQAMAAVLRVINRTGGATRLRLTFRDAEPMSLDVFLATVNDLYTTMVEDRKRSAADDAAEGTEQDADGDDESDAAAPRDRVTNLASKATAEEVVRFIRAATTRQWNEAEADLIRTALLEVSDSISADHDTDTFAA